MNTTRILLSCLLALTLAAAGCSKEGADTPAGAKRTASVEIVAAEAKGFTVGAMMAANPVYVFFDPQCPHCAHLWQASKPLHAKRKFVWIPVGLMNAASTSQGAALLSAGDPMQRMDEHEQSILAGRGGMSASSPPAELEQAVKSNTRLFNNFGIESVPFLIARNPRTGQTVTHNGSMGTAALADLLGVDAP